MSVCEDTDTNKMSVSLYYTMYRCLYVRIQIQIRCLNLYIVLCIDVCM